MGDTNQANLGENANAKMVGAGQTVNQTIIENQVINESARQSDARFSLPKAPGDFTGRALEIETLVKQLTSEKKVAITGLAGMGGVGKSALAMVVANEVAGNFPDARLWVDMRGLDENAVKPVDAMRLVIAALEPLADLRNANDAQIEQSYRGLLDGKRALIVLDNARDNAQIRPLLQAEATFLVTARAALTEGGLRALRLDVMQEADARAYLVAQVGRLTAEVADMLAQVCGYLPLALKIAGSYLAARPNVNPVAYAEQLRMRRLELLRERGDGELNVEAAIDETYRNMTDELQERWRVLGVFPAPFWGLAAEYVWGMEEEDGKAEMVLGDLVRESFVDYNEREGKYRLHDLLREFAWERMTEDERWKAQKRHAEFYVQVAGAAENSYREGNEKILEGLKLFDEEVTHIRAGQGWAAANWERDEDAARFCCHYALTATDITDLRLSQREFIQWMNHAVNGARKLGNKEDEANALGNLGVAYIAVGEVRRAIEFDEQRLVIAREIGDRGGEGIAFGNLGSAYYLLGEVRRAIEFYEQSLVIVREIGDRRGEGAVLGNLGIAYSDLGELRRAIEFYEQFLAIARQIGDRRGQGNALGSLGIAYSALGELRRAIEFYEQFLAIARQIGDRRGEGIALSNLGVAYTDLGEVRGAIEFHEQFLAIARDLGDRLGEASALGNLGIAYRRTGEVQRAIKFYAQCLSIAREIEDRRGEGRALMNMGLAYEELGDLPKVREDWQAALAIFEEIEDPNAEKVKGWLAVLQTDSENG